jgi:hypothetical protein
MKLEGMRKSKADNDVDIYILSLGLQELKLLRAIVDSALQYTPRVVETTQTCGRLRNFAKILQRILKP